MKNHLFLFSIAICLLFASCSGVRFGHLAKVKYNSSEKENSFQKKYVLQKDIIGFIDSSNEKLMIINDLQTLQSIKNKIRKNNVVLNEKKPIISLISKNNLTKINETQTVNIKNQNINNISLALTSLILSILGYLSIISLLIFFDFLLFEYVFTGILASIFMEILALIFGISSIRNEEIKAKIGIFLSTLFLLTILIFIVII